MVRVRAFYSFLPFLTLRWLLITIMVLKRLLPISVLETMLVPVASGLHVPRVSCGFAASRLRSGHGGLVDSV
jgi:hypothetical protein